MTETEMRYVEAVPINHITNGIILMSQGHKLVHEGREYRFVISEDSQRYNLQWKKDDKETWSICLVSVPTFFEKLLHGKVCPV